MSKPVFRSARRYSVSRSLVYGTLIAAFMFGAVELALFLVGVTPRGVTADPYVGFVGDVPLFVRDTGSDGVARMITAGSKQRFFNAQEFALDKTKGSLRVFCLGGSTTYGRPYDDSTSFCGWLRAYLKELIPQRRIEVVNAGGISYASYRVARVMEELASHEADLFIVYSGHNEFLERRTYKDLIERPWIVQTLDAWLSRTRLYSALQRLAADIGAVNPDASSSLLSGEVNTVLDTVGPDAFYRNDELARRITEHYEFNLRRMAEIGRAHDAGLIFVRPASSLKDCKPFKSDHSPSLTEIERQQWQTLFAAGRREQLAGNLKSAKAAYERAARLNRRHAETWYRLGETLMEMGRHEGARQAFVSARDEDVCPLRSTTPLDQAFMRFVTDTGVRYVDYGRVIERTMRASYQHGVPGKEVFLDHVHPTIEGHRLLAHALLEKMAEIGVILATNADSNTLSRVNDRVLAQVDERKQGIALRNLAKVLSWAGKTEDAARVARLALEKLPDDAESMFVLATHAMEQLRWDDAIAAYRKIIEIDPLFVKAYSNLGIVMVKAGRPEAALSYYHQALAIDADNSNAHYNLANAHARLGRNKLAAHHFRQALTRDPSDADARFNLARLLARQGDTDGAIVEYERLLKMHPDDDAARDDLTRLRARSANATVAAD